MIDAHPPVISRLEVPSIEVGPDGTVQVTITADGNGYSFGSGTTVNGVPLSSSNVTGTEHTGGLYELSYVVSTSDQYVSPGDLEVSLVLADPAGNISTSFTSVQTNSLEVYTIRPTVVLAGTPEICEGESAELSVFLQGRGPWTFTIYDGTDLTTYEDVEINTYTIYVSPVALTTYSVQDVWDYNGVKNSGNNDWDVMVMEKTEVAITNLAPGYTIADERVLLEANVSGGTFSGPGVISSTGYFYPNIADTVNSPHTIVFLYLNENGCTSRTSSLVFVLGVEGDLFIPDSIVCEEGEPFTVNGSNVNGSIGSFRLKDASQQYVGGLIDLGDNSATIDPALLSAGEYTVEYIYFDVVTQTLKKTFVVEELPIPRITSLESEYCTSDPATKVVMSDPRCIVEGPGISGDIENGFLFNPAEALIGENNLTCTILSGNGCVNASQEVIEVKFAPEVSFLISTSCISANGGTCGFSNLTNEKLSVETWDWNFGDIGSGSDNRSDLVEPDHFYLTSGMKQIRLTATTSNGCVATHMLDTLLGVIPDADFTWESDCYLAQHEMEFFHTTENQNAGNIASQWTFSTSTGQILGTISEPTIGEGVGFSFPGIDTYRVELYVSNSAGCNDSITRELSLRPSIQLNGDNYHEDFDESEGLWTIHSEDKIESWVWGIPDFDGLDGEPDNRAWYTQLPSDIIGYKENSWIQSPCFDFSDSKRPLIQLELARSFVPLMNGAVLQYREKVDDGWTTLGSENKGKGWYNLDHIINMPGGSDSGWGLKVFNPDKEWQIAVHDLGELAGKEHVTFRMAISTEGVQGIGNQGFALNNIAIGERMKYALMEYFTNSSAISSSTSDQLVDDLSGKLPKDMLDLQYHMDYPGGDPMNENNPLTPSARSDYYGVTSVPFAIVNGGSADDLQFDFSTPEEEPSEDLIRKSMLHIPEFIVDLSVEWGEESLVSNTSVTCNVDEYPGHLQLYIVIYERSVTAYTGGNGDSQFSNVVLDMVPSPAGKLINFDWGMDSCWTVSNSWVYKEYVENVEDLGVAVFVQDRATGRIVQTALNELGGRTGIPVRTSELSALNIYPNPAKDAFYINLGAPLEKEGRFDLIDLSGRIVMNGLVPPGHQIYQVDIQDLLRGMYVVRWFESGQFKGMGKVVKTE